MSRSRLWTTAVLAVLLSVGMLADDDADELLRTLDESMGVVWVSVDMATTEDGSMDWEAVSKTFRDFYASYRDDVPFRCWTTPTTASRSPIRDSRVGSRGSVRIGVSPICSAVSSHRPARPTS